MFRAISIVFAMTFLAGVSAAQSMDDGHITYAEPAEAYVAGMANFDVFGIKLGDDMKAAQAALEAKGWVLQPTDCPSFGCPNLSTTSGYENPVTRKFVKFYERMVFLSETDHGVLTVKVRPPLPPQMTQAVVYILYESIRDLTENNEPIATAAWKAGIAEKALKKYGAPKNAYVDTDYRNADACGTGYPDYDEMGWYSVELDDRSMAASRYVLLMKTVIECRQAFSIEFADGALVNPKSDDIDAIRSYLIEQESGSAGTNQSPDF